MNSPKLFYIKLIKVHQHQGVKKVAFCTITTHHPSILPKYLKDRGWKAAHA